MGGLTVEEAQPGPTHGAFNPRKTLLGHSTHCPGVQARQQDVSTALHSHSFRPGFIMQAGAGVVLPIEQLGQLRLREGM